MKALVVVMVLNYGRQPYHPAAQDWLPTEANQGWAGQYLDGRPPGKTHPVICVGPNTPV